MMSSSSPKPPYPVSTHLFIPHHLSNPLPTPVMSSFLDTGQPLILSKVRAKTHGYTYHSKVSVCFMFWCEMFECFGPFAPKHKTHGYFRVVRVSVCFGT